MIVKIILALCICVFFVSEVISLVNALKMRKKAKELIAQADKKLSEDQDTNLQ